MFERKGSLKLDDETYIARNDKHLKDSPHSFLFSNLQNEEDPIVDDGGSSKESKLY